MVSEKYENNNTARLYLLSNFLYIFLDLEESILNKYLF